MATNTRDFDIKPEDGVTEIPLKVNGTYVHIIGVINGPVLCYVGSTSESNGAYLKDGDTLAADDSIFLSCTKNSSATVVVVRDGD